MKMDDVARVAGLLCATGDLAEAIRGLGGLSHGCHSAFGKLTELARDYALMKRYAMAGAEDKNRSCMYDGFLLRAYNIAARDLVRSACRNSESPTLRTTIGAADKFGTPLGEVKDVLVSFVQDAAMASLEGGDVAGRLSSLHDKHRDFADSLFNHILVGCDFSDGDVESLVGIAVSPEVDIADACLVVSAVTLSNLLFFDERKVEVLSKAYRGSADEQVRQRAVVGIAFGLPEKGAVPFKVLGREMEILCGDSSFCNAVAELQKQLFVCMDAEKDTKILKEDVLPWLAKYGNGEKWTLDMPVDGDMDGIFGPEDGSEERAMDSMDKLLRMQKKGADVYYEGFSRLKRFPFFYKLSNWFVPFYMEHPGLRAQLPKGDGLAIFGKFISGWPFCDSDKYSFAHVFGLLLDKIPESMRSAILETGNVGYDMAGLDTPSRIRLLYLQDLYRFFNLYTEKGLFASPFELEKGGAALFYANEWLGGKGVAGALPSVARFFMGRKQYREALDVLEAKADMSDYDSTVAYGFCLLYTKQYEKASNVFDISVALNPSGEKALSGKARAVAAMGWHGQAAMLFADLQKLFPGNTAYAAGKCLAMVNAGMQAEALDELYRLRYENPSDANLARTLAWGLLKNKEAAKSAAVYTSLMDMEGRLPSDRLNMAYSQWASGDLPSAASSFAEYLSQSGDGGGKARLLEAFAEDAEVLEVYGLGLAEKMIMADSVAERTAG